MQMNIILNGKLLVDWEQVLLLRVGMNGWSVRHFSVVNRNHVDYASEKTLPMAKAFWDGFVGALPGSLRNGLLMR
jgi:hypothetical protein